MELYEDLGVYKVKESMPEKTPAQSVALPFYLCRENIRVFIRKDFIAYYEQRKINIFFVVLLSCNFKLRCLATVQCTFTCLQHGPGDVETLAP